MKFTIACLIATTALGIQLADETKTMTNKEKDEVPDYTNEDMTITEENDEDQAYTNEALLITDNMFDADANGDDVVTNKEITDMIINFAEEAGKKMALANAERKELSDWVVDAFDKMEAHIGRMDGQITKEEMKQAAFELLKSGELCFQNCKWSWTEEDDQDEELAQIQDYSDSDENCGYRAQVDAHDIEDFDNEINEDSDDEDKKDGDKEDFFDVYVPQLAQVDVYAEDNGDEDDEDQQGPFSGLFKNPDYKLRLATQVARHGERSPSHYFEHLVEGPQFDVEEKSLTKKGAESHHAIGARVREALGWSDLTALNPADVYVLSSFKERAIGSAVAQLMGLAGETLAWPLPSVDESGFTISLPSRKEDYITRADKKTCPRVKGMIKAIEEAPGTVELHKTAESWLEENFFPRVRELAGLPMADTETVLDIIDYIDWARKNDMKLKFELTRKELDYIRVADDVGVYEDSAAHPDQPYLDSWELQHLWAEMSEVIRGARTVQDASTLTKYFPEAAEEGATHPKLLVVQGHGIASLKELFGHIDFDAPEPASTIWVNMYECETCEGDDKFVIEGYFCKYSDNLDACQHSSSPNGDVVGDVVVDGTITNAKFEELVTGGLEAYATLIGSESTDIADICKIEYVHDEVKLPFTDPEEFWKDFTYYHYFDIVQE